jgi:hypothetical protein
MRNDTRGDTRGDMRNDMRNDSRNDSRNEMRGDTRGEVRNNETRNNDRPSKPYFNAPYANGVSTRERVKKPKYEMETLKKNTIAELIKLAHEMNIEGVSGLRNRN